MLALHLYLTNLRPFFMMKAGVIDMNPFVQDGYLLPTASLNMLPVGDGVTAKDLCASSAVTARLQAFLTAHGLQIDKHWFSVFLNCLTSPGCAAEAHACVEAIARDICRVPLTLKGVTPHVHADWTPAHWAHWRKIDRLYLAGGMLDSPFGATLLTAMQHCLAENGLTDLELRLAAHPVITSLIGAGRYASRFCDNALLFDLGHTNIKCGSLSKANGRYEIHSYPLIPSREMQWDYSERAAAEILDEHITDVITALYLQIVSEGREPGDTVSMSVANYVTADRFAVRGGYGKLNLIAADYKQHLTDALSARLGRRMQLHFIHDGTAGAYAVQTERWRSEAFLGLGTSLSVGFPDEAMDFPFPYVRIEHAL